MSKTWVSKLFSQNFLLKNSKVELTPLEISHYEPLFAMSQDPDIWKYNPFIQVKDKETFDKYFEKAISQIASKTRQAFVVKSQFGNEMKIVGTTSYYNLAEEYPSLSIGYTWFPKEYQGKGYNKATKILLLSNAFNNLEAERVDFYIDARNVNSQNSIKKLGAIYEATLRSHLPIPGGIRRDTSVLSLIKEDWLNIKGKLEGLF